MPTPESLVKAFAAGMIEAMLGTEEKPKGKKEKPTVVPVETVNAAVRQYLDGLAAQEQAPVQEDLFAPRSVDMGDAIYDRVQEARARVEAQNQDEPEPGTYLPDMPEGGPPWQSPIQ